MNAVVKAETTGASPIAIIDKSFDFVPTSFTEAREIAEYLATSNLLPKEFRGEPANVMIAIAMGTDLGLRPMQALQNIAVINGKPSMWGDLLLALVRANPVFVSINEKRRQDDVNPEHYNEKEKPHPLDGVTAVCTVVRRTHATSTDTEEPVTATFSVRDARRAGLWGKQGPWTNYPRRMLQMRARGFALRDCFPDVLKGMTTREEAYDIAPTRDGAIEGEFREAPDDVIDRINAQASSAPPVPPEPPMEVAPKPEAKPARRTTRRSAPATGTTIEQAPEPEQAPPQAASAEQSAEPEPEQGYRGPDADELIEMVGRASDSEELNNCEAIANDMPGGEERDRALKVIHEAQAQAYKKASGG